MIISEKELAKLQEEVFVNPKESIKAVLGNSYMKEIINNKKVETGIAIVTEDRLYFKGNSYDMDSNQLVMHYQEQTIDLRDMTGTSFTTSNNVSFFVTSLVFFLISAILVRSDIAWVALITMGICVTFAYFYFKDKTTLYQVDYAGGSIYLETSWYSTDEIQDFEKQLRRAKDLVVNSERGRPRVAVQEQSDATMTKIDKLKACQELLDGGIINEDEFNKLKEEVFS